jgi:hypothetical protein
MTIAISILFHLQPKEKKMAHGIKKPRFSKEIGVFLFGGKGNCFIT